MKYRSLREIDEVCFVSNGDRFTYKRGLLVRDMNDKVMFITSTKGGYIAYIASEIDSEVYVRDNLKPASKIMKTQNEVLESVTKEVGAIGDEIF